MKHNIFDDSGAKPEERRKSIFELYKQNNTMDKDFLRIDCLLNSSFGAVSRYSQGKNLSVMSSAEKMFPKWKNRGRCLTFNDFLITIKFDSIKEKAPNNEKMFLSYIELAYNAWYLTNSLVLCYRDHYKWGNAGIALKNMMDEILSEMNQKAYYDPETEQCLIGEDSPQVTAAAEATEPEVASLILQYNYRRFVGDVANKKVILVQLGHEIMGKESELRANNQTNLFESITKALNNLDLRHNNTSPGSNDYKEQVTHLTAEELEKWYDETYQLILYAILVLDNLDRKKRVDEFIKQLNQKKK